MNYWNIYVNNKKVGNQPAESPFHAIELFYTRLQATGRSIDRRLIRATKHMI